MKSLNLERLIEQAALLFASFVWTSIVLTIIILFWAYQNVQARDERLTFVTCWPYTNNTHRVIVVAEPV